MNYELEISKSFPEVLNTLDGTRPPLVAGSGSATLLSTASTLSWSAFTWGRETSPFSMEVWYLPVAIGSSSEIVVIGHDIEGVLYNGTEFIMRVKYLDGTILEGRWTPDQPQRFHVVMSYDTSNFFLHINGELVVTLAASEGEWLSGNGGSTSPVNLNFLAAGTGSGVYDSAALYYRALPPTEIRQHYSWGSEVLDAISVATSRGGQTWSLRYADVDILQTFEFNRDNWNTGLMLGVHYFDGLRAETVAGGTWMGSIPLSAITDSLAGVHVTWEGEFIDVSYSLDGTTWTPLTEYVTVAEDATADSLDIKVEFADDEGWIDSLTLDLLNSRVMIPASGGRNLTFSSAAFDHTPGHQLNFQQDSGAVLRSGFLEIQPDQEATTIRAVEAWLKLDSADGRVLTMSGSHYVNLAAGVISFTGITAYRNGVALSGQAVPTGQWDHYLFVATSDVPAPVRVGSTAAGASFADMTVGHLAVYPATFSAQQAADLYAQNIGAATLQIIDASNFVVAEPATPVEIYAHVWSIVSG